MRLPHFPFCHREKKAEMSVHLIVGPMFAGKTTELLRLLKRYEDAGCQCVLVKWAGDNRYTTDHVVKTHDGMFEKSALSAARLGDVEFAPEVVAADVVGIDELFFEDLVDVVDRLANAGKMVVVAGLSGKFDRKPFPGTERLFSIADSIQMLSAVCKFCWSPDAAFTMRLSGGTEDIEIGGSDKYAPCCRTCYFAYLPSSSSLNTKQNTHVVFEDTEKMDVLGKHSRAWRKYWTLRGVRPKFVLNKH